VKRFTGTTYYMVELMGSIMIIIALPILTVIIENNLTTKGCLLTVFCILSLYLMFFSTWWTIEYDGVTLTLKNKWIFLGKRNYSIPISTIVKADFKFYNWTGIVTRKRPILTITTLEENISIKGPDSGEMTELLSLLKIRKNGGEVSSDI
jgi:hypothetical protein